MVAHNNEGDLPATYQHVSFFLVIKPSSINLPFGNPSANSDMLTPIIKTMQSCSLISQSTLN